jgi:hypothetical protein
MEWGLLLLIDVDIYLDVDGVLFCRENGILELRDGALGFLHFLVNNFENCYWLSSWGSGFNDVLKLIYGDKIASRFKTANWEHGPIDKASGIKDWNRRFIWIEDGISIGAMEELQKHNCVDSFINCPFTGSIHKLYDIKDELKRKFNIV